MDGHVDPSVHCVQVAHELGVKAAEEPCSRVSPRRLFMQGGEKELVELVVEATGVGECRPRG
jgi:hypothetical protein